ncbi:uncharacterized protein LOC124914507 isoform X2 [Impatiens glandulifera]|uniref:uncharacterized protein LOC124914507 isoform X2 n=1 Tax=Impatiens glandulifera TaxID=253017 RepID=UPI001FB04EBA|nr:uncharacterized protein LOC124914507 isoform X2 [Impatiens glandulifera]
MKAANPGFLVSDSKSKYCICSLFVTAALVCSAYFIGSAYLSNNFNQILPLWNMNETRQSKQNVESNKGISTKEIINASLDPQYQKCKSDCRPHGSNILPKGIVSGTSNLDMLPLWGPVSENIVSKTSIGLLAMAVGIKQKEIVKIIVEKFLADDFVVMLFHYDDVVDEWRDLGWNNRVIHVSATNQTKWWFAKRFLHPDLVVEYDYIFLWDEDLGVDNFNPKQYLLIVKDEGLEISQPALDPTKSDVHHPITARVKNSRVHRYYKFKGGGRCYGNSTNPPCVGWVEMMAPVFSRAAWQCAWYMIQNDLIHAWGLDMQLGYCAQGERTKNVGVVDSEYIVHIGLPTLGGAHLNKGSEILPVADNRSEGSEILPVLDNRSEVRRQSFVEMQIFRKRWAKAVEDEDECWDDPYEQQTDQKNG